MTRRTSHRRTSLRRNSRRIPAGMKSWHGIDNLERRENLIHNRLVGVILDDMSKGTLTRSRAEEYIHEAQAFVDDLESQWPPGGARGQAGRYKTRTLDKLRGYLVRARKQLGMVANRRRTSRNLRPNPSTWYSGDTTVSVQYRDKSGSYDTTVRSPDGSRKIVVGRAPADRTAVDSEAAYKSAAHAAISFAMDEGLDCQPDYNAEGSGYVISRSKKLRKNGHYRDPSTKVFRDLYASGKLRLGDAGSTATNREGLTWNEWRAAAGTGGLTTAKLLAAWRAGEDPTEYRAMKRNVKLTGKIEDDTGIIPEAVADGVLEEFQLETDFALPAEMARTLADELATQAQAIYSHNASFAKKIRSNRDHGNAGRDTLYAFMRHWLASALKKQHPAAFKKLPGNWGWDR